MGMSNPTEGKKSPIDHFFSFNMKTGKFFHKERSATEKEEMKFPLQFVVVDDGLAQIRGYDQKTKRTVASNFIKNGQGEFTVKDTKLNEVLGSGLWKNIKAFVPNYAKYTKLLFVYFPKDDRYGMIQFHGTSLVFLSDHLATTDNKWSGEGRLFKCAKAEKNTDSDYYGPVFESRPLADEGKELEIKENLTKWDAEILQPYISSLLSAPTQNTTQNKPVNEPVDESGADDKEMDDLPF